MGLLATWFDILAKVGERFGERDRDDYPNDDPLADPQSYR
jgi:hypothetical protein